MSSINASLNLRVKASGKGQIAAVSAELSKLEKQARKARDSSGKFIKGEFSGPLRPDGSFFGGGGGPGGGGPGGGPRSGGRAQKPFNWGRLNTQLDHTANNLERVGGFGKQLLTKPIEEFFSLEYAMARVSSKMDNLSTQDYGRLKKAAVAAGAATGYSSKEAADGLAEMAAAGFKVEQQISALPAVLQLAKAGELDVGRATAVAASTMSQFGLRAADTGHIGDVLVAAANASVISVEDLAETLKYVGPIAHTAGLSLEETTAAAAVLGNAGIEASQAGTSLRAVLSAFAKQTPKAVKAMNAVGISSKQMGEGVHDPIKLLDLLGQKLKNATEAKKLKTLADVFGAPAAPGAASLMEAISKIGEDGLSAIESARRATGNANGSLERAAKILGGTGVSKMKLFTATVSASAAEFGEAFAPALLESTDELKKLVAEGGAWAQENPGIVSGIGKITLGLTAASLAGSGALRVLGAAAPLWSGISSGARGAAIGITAIEKGLTAVELQAGITRGALSKTFGVAGAAYAGYAFGTFLDEWIGKTFKLRGELLSTELALRAGEAQGKAADKTPIVGKDILTGKQQTAADAHKALVTLDDVAALLGGVKGGNAARNALEEEFAHEQRLRQGRTENNPATRADADVRPLAERFNAVSGQLEISVKDDRITTKLKGTGARLGEQVTR